MHSVLDLEPNRSYTKTDKSLEQTLVESSLCSLLTHDNWSELAMVANKNYVLCSFKNRDKSLRLGSLSSFINKHLLELKRLKPLIKCGDTSGADDICIPQNFIFSLSLEVFEHLIVFLV